MVLLAIRYVEKDQLPIYLPHTSGTQELQTYNGMYSKLAGRLMYLTILRPDFAYAVGVRSHFMYLPHFPHLEFLGS